MDLSKTVDFLQAFDGHCHLIGPSCLSCKIQVLSSIDSRGHKYRDQCLVWALRNTDMAIPILQEYLDSHPFVPKHGETYFYIDPNGSCVAEDNTGFMCDYGLIVMRNCFRSPDAAAAHKDEIMAKYAAIDDGRYPD